MSAPSGLRIVTVRLALAPASRLVTLKVVPCSPALSDIPAPEPTSAARSGMPLSHTVPASTRSTTRRMEPVRSCEPLRLGSCGWPRRESWIEVMTGPPLVTVRASTGPPRP